MPIASGFLQFFNFEYHYWVGAKGPADESVVVLLRYRDWHPEVSEDNGVTWERVDLNARDWGWDLTPDPA